MGWEEEALLSELNCREGSEMVEKEGKWGPNKCREPSGQSKCSDGAGHEWAPEGLGGSAALGSGKHYKVGEALQNGQKPQIVWAIW